ncbi:hypothetical protein CAEBREN_03337 [Caenorhabditis brenneri]|uniref:Uncharacterized protein n=1 Tax=Caenorhabditis brenneri TaxID=135651 RepID=G0MVY3_CAEBE|nr:hypothetical protein CAEBREN_03337 [Caenorhabditis brenneri]
MTETPKLSIYEKGFAKTDKTDAILVVDGKRLHVNKAISHKLTRHEKLILADKYKSEKLSTYALGLYDTKRSFYDFWYEKDRKFSDELKGKLFDSFFDRYADSLH